MHIIKLTLIPYPYIFVHIIILNLQSDEENNHPSKQKVSPLLVADKIISIWTMHCKFVEMMQQQSSSNATL